MTTQILSSPPGALSQTSGEQQISPVMQQGAQFQQKLCALLDAEDREKLQAKNKRTQELLQLIQQEVQKRSEEIGYDYEKEDYARRLCLTDEGFEEILKEKVLIGNLGAYYTELTNIYGENPKLLKKLLREYCIEDLVYESVEGGEKKIMRIQSIRQQDSLDNYIKLIESLGSSGNKLLDFQNNQLGKYLGKDGMMQLAKALGSSGNKLLYFHINQLGEHLGTDGMAQLTKVFKGTGVKSVDFSCNDLGVYLGENGMAQLAKAFKGTGVKSVDFKYNDLGVYLGEDGMIQLAEALGKSGIKSVSFYGNHLGEYLGDTGLEKLENTLKEYGIQYNISD